MALKRPILHHGRGTGPPAPEHGGRLPVALATPFGLGPALSSLGWQTVYRLTAPEPTLAVERFHLAGADRTPCSLESGRHLTSFPVLALSVSFEEDILRLVETLRAAQVPVRREHRPDFPLILAGGPLAFLNPAPLAPLADACFVGEAEAGLVEVMAELSRIWLEGGDKQAMLQAIAQRPGVYAPGLTPTPVRRVLAPRSPSGACLDDPGYSCFTGPEATFSDAMLLEINRGCPYGCRFCAAGYVYRPPRQADVADLKALVAEAEPQKVGLVGTALTDWPDLLPFLAWLHERRIKFSLASVRADGLTEELVAFLRRVGVRSVTLALEAPSERLRTACGKKLDPGELVAAVERCARHGVNHLKLYLIVGWPGESDQDYEELAAYLAEIADARDRGGKKGKPMRLTISVSSLVPKPQTPMQWAPMAPEETLKARIKQVKGLARSIKACTADADSPARARLQGLLARGGEEMADLAELAADLGSWTRALKAWERAEDLVPHVLDRTRDQDETFPWEVVDTGVDRSFLWREWTRYLQALPSPACPAGSGPGSRTCDQCRACGLDRFTD